MIRSRVFPWCLPALFVIAACGRSSPEPASGQPFELGVVLSPLEVPAVSGSAHPQLTSSSKGAILTWLDQDESKDDSQIFGANIGRLDRTKDCLVWR